MRLKRSPRINAYLVERGVYYYYIIMWAAEETVVQVAVSAETAAHDVIPGYRGPNGKVITSEGV